MKYRKHPALRFARFLVSLALLAVTVACGGGGGGSAAPAVPNVASSSLPLLLDPVASIGDAARPVQAVLNFRLSNAVARSAGSSATRRAQFISPSAASLKIVVTPQGGAASAPVTGTCTTATCTVNFTAAIGANALAFTLYDGAGGTGNVLGSYATTIIAQPNGINTFQLVANGAVDHVGITLGSTSITAGIAGSVALTVNAFDKDNNTIIGPGNYVDAGGAPVTLILNTVDNQAGGAGVTLLKGARRIIAPGQASTTLAYNGLWLDSTVVSVQSTRPLGGAISGATLSTTPTFTEYTTGITAGSDPNDITTGPDGNLWMTEYSNSCIAKVRTTGAVTEYCGLSGGVDSIIAGPDGNMWFTEHGGAYGKISTAGIITEYSAAGYVPDALTAGPDGNIYITTATGGTLGVLKVTTKGAMSLLTTLPYLPDLITVGPDGNLWLSEPNDDRIAKITLAGVVTQYSVGTGSTPEGMAVGGDGNIWFTETGTTKIGRITLSGAVSHFTGITGTPGLYALRPGPDGNLWFPESSPNRIGRVTPAGVISEYATGYSASGYSNWLILGPDGNLWLPKINGNRIAKFVF